MKEALSRMLDTQQHCAIVVDNEGYLEGILTYSDIKRRLFKNPADSTNRDMLQADVCVSAAVITSFSSSFVVKECSLPKTSAGKYLPCFLDLHERDKLSRERMWSSHVLSRHRPGNCEAANGG